ncbi:cytochrome c [Herbaspirillum sp. RTI4]|uniref:c-type cytochrome n=1 Tax=Herbaspirillum sp. RTI4 TaxID=3048640 RepID=UPI002AB42B20|nr:cytochrome c [Herbaspirillum sp. RTI4]MDY7577654.1 cytochrome c [Herbaspirillum sp. RTI4]MEA9982180.1 cytochrome c [Herbaspirillum sp. RTI4]
MPIINSARVRACALPFLLLWATLAYAASSDPMLLKRGEYLATAGDCIACHSSAAGKPFAGGLSLATPLGAIVSTNITPSKEHGIGHYTLEQFDAALRHGKRADGAYLYPAMPYTAYAQLNGEDVQALYAYFMESVTPVEVTPPPTVLPFPFNIRWSMAGWNLLFLNDKPFVPDQSKSVEWNRGAYLVQGLAHCSTCHTPRNILMAEDSSRSLGGGVVGTWYAPNISSDAISGIGAWSVDEIAAYLRTGRVAGKAQAGGPMAEAIDNSFRHLSDPDIKAMAVYLRTTPAVRDAADTQAAHTWGQPVAAYEEVRGMEVPADESKWSGAQLYDANCASCHNARGEGSAMGGNGAALPSLFHNTTLGHANTNNLVMAILEGVQRKEGGPELTMPAFDRSLNDEQIVTLSNYLLHNYGNTASQVMAQQVKVLRAGGEPSSLALAVQIALGVAVFILLLVLGWFLWRRFRSARSL